MIITCKEVSVVLLLLLLSCNGSESNSHLNSFTVKYIRSIDRVELDQLQNQGRIDKPEDVEIEYDEDEIRVNFNLIQRGGKIVGDIDVYSDTISLLYEKLEPRTREFNLYNMEYIINIQENDIYKIVIGETTES